MGFSGGDASGVALVLAQAEYWSQIPAEQRPHNMLFLLTARHMAHAAGTATFLDDHRDLLEHTVLEVHLEHAANRCVVDDEVLVPLDEPEVRWWFTSRNPHLESAVIEAIGAEDLRRSMVFKPDILWETPPTDGAWFHQIGVPLVNFLTAPMYLFDPADTMDKIHVPSLVPLTRAVARIIASTRDVSASQMRAGVQSD